MAFRSILFFCFVSLVFSIQLPQDVQKFMDDLHDICIKKSGITEADHAAYDVRNNPHDEKIQCYMKCLLMESKWMNSDGTIQYDLIETVHPIIKEAFEDAVNKCRNIEDDPDLCKKASNFNVCLYEANPADWFMA